MKKIVTFYSDIIMKSIKRRHNRFFKLKFHHNQFKKNCQILLTKFKKHNLAKSRNFRFIKFEG